MTTNKHGSNDIRTFDISTIKQILNDKNMRMLVDTDEMETEKYTGPLRQCPDDKSNDSSSTLFMLDKTPINFFKFILSIGATLSYVGSGATGHTFHGEIAKDGEIVYEFAVKISPYPKHESYGPITKIDRPENSEIMMLRCLSYFVSKKETPHLLRPIKTFYSDINNFLLLSKGGYIKGRDTTKYDDFVKKYEEGKYENTVSVLLSEWANRGDFLTYTKLNYKNYKLEHWKVFFFQILSVLAVIQCKYPSFRHNDMKANNILIKKIKKNSKTDNHWIYIVAGIPYKLPNIRYQIALWDFDFSCIAGIVDNIKVTEQWTTQIGITSKENKYYDVHYFFNTLIQFIPEIVKYSDNSRCNIKRENIKNTEIKQTLETVRDFIYRIIPEQYRGGSRVNKKGRLLVDDEFITPREILENDPFFAEFKMHTT